MISIDIKENKICLTGSLEYLKKDIKLFLKSKFKTVMDSTLTYEITFENERDAIEILEKALKHYQIEYQFSDEVKKKQKEFFLEEKKFKEFSDKAKKIRNNECDIQDFNEFKKSLEKNMPNRTLYELQFLSAYHLAFSQNSCNFSVPGAGKTSIVYGAYTFLKNLPPDNYKHIDNILIIGPLNSFGPWEDEYESCFGKKADSKRIVNMSSKEREDYFQGYLQSEVTLISYITAANSAKDIEIFLKNKKVMVVLDEAHKIKSLNEDATIAPRILEIAQFAASRVILTGTPAPNGYKDLYNLYKFIWPNKDIIKFSIQQLNQMSKPDVLPSIKSTVPKLIDNISPFFIRIKKDDFDNMPVPIENPLIEVDMDEEQLKIYNYIENNCIKSIKSNVDTSSITKAKLIRMMQASTNPLLLTKPINDLYMQDMQLSNVEILNTISNYNKIPNKFKRCIELTKEILNRNEEEKVVIWANFVENLKLLQELFYKENMYSEIIYGATPIESDDNIEDIMTREKIVKLFNEKNSKLRILIANPYAASESISLHKVCHNAIYLERNFNAATFIQSKDRIHRYGLKKEDKINYYYLGSKNTIDEVIDSRLQQKELNMKKIIESEEIPLFSNYFDIDIDENDIKELLKEYVGRNRRE